jgi:hypothetical protein
MFKQSEEITPLLKLAIFSTLFKEKKFSSPRREANSGDTKQRWRKNTLCMKIFKYQQCSKTLSFFSLGRTVRVPARA